MKTSPRTTARCLRRLVLSAFALGVIAAPSVRAGLTLEMNVVRYNYGSYFGYEFYPYLATNTTPPSLSFGDYTVNSPQAPTNGASATYHFDTNGFYEVGGITWGYGDFNSMLHDLTNGNWSIFVTNSVTTNVYHFSVTASIASNSLPDMIVTFPTNNAVNVTNQPTYTWQGPTNYSDLVVYEYNNSSNLPVTQTSWLSPRVLYQGINNFNAHYDSNSTTAVVSSLPLDDALQPISSWVSTAHLQDYFTSQFTVGTVDPSGTRHTLVAHYAWDGTNADGSASGADTSGNGFDMTFSGSHGSQGGVDSTADTAAGPRAIQFHDGDGNSAGYVGWNSTPTNLLAALEGSFSVSCWIKTTQGNFGWDQAPAYYGAGIVSADNAGQANDLIPIALTGSKIGFNTGGDTEDVTLNSSASVNDGIYHHVVVTRNQPTGQKIIYIDGVPDSFSSGTTNLLNSPQLLTIGALSDARNPDARSTYYYNGFDGKVDDLQIYSGVLSSNEVAQLFASPGITANQVITVPLVARYDFEDTNSAGIDSSGHGNDANCGSGNGGTNVDTFSSDAAVGTYAREYFGDTSLCFSPNGAACFNNLSNALYGSFSWTAWVKTTNSANADYANAYFGAPIWFEYSDGTNQAILSITGSKAAFTVGNPGGGSDTTLHSSTSVNDGTYHFIAATRNAASGLMNLYVDGNLQATGVSTNGPRIASAIMFLAGGDTGFYKGLLDDVRVYAGELSAAEVATLSGHSFTDFNPALDTTGLNWSTIGDSIWSVEATNTYSGSPAAARSGSVTNTQSSTLSVTVTGPGTLTFNWSSIANDPNGGFDYEFYIDDPNTGDVADLYGDNSWQPIQQMTGGPVLVPAGQHTLSWTVFANGDTDPTQVGFLDQVSYVPDSIPVITLNPFSQTNYPGYPVWLSANATSNPAATWQWYKVGFGAISGATSADFIPTNSGTTGVAGSYYAIASNDAGSAITTTASVGFVSAPLPPDWSRAVKSPFNAEFGTNLVRDYYGGCAVDSAGNVFVADQYIGNVNVQSNFVTLNTLTTVGTYGGAALVKHDATGNALWAVGLTNDQPASYSYALCVAPAPGGGAYLASVLVGTNWLGTNRFANNGGGSVLLSRFDATGSNLWSRLIGQTNQVFNFYNSLVADAAGNVTVGGIMGGTADFGGTNLTASGYEGFLAQYNASGALLSAQLFPGIPRNLAYGGGRIYFALSSVISGGVTNLSLGSFSNLTQQAYGLAAVNATNGQALWLRGVGERFGARNNGGVSDDVPLVCVSGADVFLTGTAYGSTAEFGGLSVSLPGGRCQYFARYDTNGNAQVARTYGGTTTMPWASAANSSGVYVSGDFDSFAYFGNALIAAPVNAQNYLGPSYFSQPFVAKFDRNGNPLWARNGVSSVQANFRGIATTADGVWASGIGLVASTVLPAQFGTNYVYSDGYLYYFGTGVTFFFTQGGLLTKITESAATGTPVTLVNPQVNGVNFQFQFLSQSGFTHNIFYRTNLVAGSWQTYSSVTGDGTEKFISLPLSLFSPAKQGFIRVSTQ